jgi:predicted nucleic acid-binding protein
MKAIADSTIILHFVHHRAKMNAIISEFGITDLLLIRISYLEILAGASENAKLNTRKILNPYPVLEFDKKAAEIGNTLAITV